MPEYVVVLTLESRNHKECHREIFYRVPHATSIRVRKLNGTKRVKVSGAKRMN